MEIVVETLLGKYGGGMNTWENILAQLESRVNPHTFSTWFKPTRLEAVKGNLLVVRVPNLFFQKWLSGDGRGGPDRHGLAGPLRQAASCFTLSRAANINRADGRS